MSEPTAFVVDVNDDCSSSSTIPSIPSQPTAEKIISNTNEGENAGMTDDSEDGNTEVFTIDEVDAKLVEARQLNDDLKFTDAMPILFHALAMLVDKHGEMSIKCAPFYAEYGISLLGQARQDATAFGMPTEEAGSDDDDDDEDEGSEDESADTATDPTVTTNDATESPTAEESAAKDELLTEEEKKMSETNKTNIKRAINIQDLDLAIENLDVARVLYESEVSRLKSSKADNSKVEELERQLASVFEWLAESEMEKEDWSACLTDISRCLEIRDRIEPPYSRELAATHNLFGKYYYTQLKPTETIKHFAKASNVFSLRAQWRIKKYAEEMTALSTNNQAILNPYAATTAAASSSLNFPIEVGNEIMAQTKKQLDKLEKLKLNLEEYNSVRSALADKIADCKDELKSGADDGDKIRRMIKQLMPSADSGMKPSVASAFPSASTTSMDAPDVNVIQIKKKRPAPAAEVPQPQDTEVKKTKTEEN